MKKNGNVSRYTPPSANTKPKFLGFRRGPWKNNSPMIELHPFRGWKPEHIVIELRRLGRM